MVAEIWAYSIVDHFCYGVVVVVYYCCSLALSVGVRRSVAMVI